jgi:GLPGLI family protein
MKHFTFLLLLLLPFGLMAQSIEQGVITYEQVIKIEFDRSRIPEGMGDMAKLIPKEQRFQKLLTFTSSQSSYVSKEKEEEVEEERGPGMHMRMMMERPDDQTFTDLKKTRVVEQKEFFGRTFLIKGEIEKLEWKITGEQKEILGHPCMKATAMKDTTEVTAWFAPSIPTNFGPETMGGQLPGMVLEVSLREGKITLTAINIEAREVKKNEIDEPKKGKEVTQEEYREIVRSKMKEMREQRGGPGGPGGGRHMMIGH